MNVTEIALLEQLKNSNEELLLKSENLQNIVIRLQEQIEWYKKQLFGKRSEKIIPANPNQLYLFDLPPEEPAKKEVQQILPHTRKKPDRNGQDAIDYPDDLPVETTVLDLSDDEKICPNTGIPLIKIGEEITDRLAQKSASFFIKRTIRPKYATPGQEENGIQISNLPSSIIPKCRVDESFLAHMLTQKFVDHLPLYRISSIMERNAIKISRKLLSQWVVKIGVALKPLRQLMLNHILDSKNLFVDESPITFLENRSEKGYMWVLVGGEGSNPPYRTYFFKENRRHENITNLIKDYNGVLHSDKYGAYEALAQKGQISWCPCWVHVRRKFIEAESGDLLFINWVLSQIHILFELEQKAWLLPPEERLHIRVSQETPIIDDLTHKIRTRLQEGKILPKSKFKEALCYYLSLSTYLKNYTLHPNARLDNNVAERAIRPLALGRKNWLFFGSAEAGEAAATILSLVQTCLGLKINPQEYLEDILRRFMDHSSQNLYELLPDQWFLHQERKV